MPSRTTRAAQPRSTKRSKPRAPRCAAELADEIRRYCDAHPHARDSIEGIAWWLTWERFSATKQDLQSAIDQLVASGLLESHRLNDGSVVFGCGESSGNRSRAKRAKRKGAA